MLELNVKYGLLYICMYIHTDTCIYIINSTNALGIEKKKNNKKINNCVFFFEQKCKLNSDYKMVL